MGTMRLFKREIRSVNGRVLAFDMNHGFGASLAPLLERIARGRVDDADIRDMFLGRTEADSDEAVEAAKKRAEALAGPTIVPGSKTGRFTALVSCHGIAMYDVEYQPYAFSTLRLSQIMGRLAADPTIETIFLDIDSPGGYVTGTQEAADAVFAARKKKSVVALINPLAASAAYWIASQAETIIGVPSADIGSIGVFMCHYDCSAMLADLGVKPTYIYAGEYKTEGNSSQPLSEEGKAFYQSEVDGTYSDFINAVARGRGVSAQTVLDKFGKGRVYGAPQAKKLGMIDDISTIQGALANWGIPDMSQEANRRRASDDRPAEPAQAEPEAEGAESAYDPKAPLKVDMDVLLTEGCERLVFRQVSAPGVITTYADRPWPAKVMIDGDIVKGGADRCLLEANGTVTVAVANGAAVYTKTHETAAGAWICKLEENSFFTPPPGADDGEQAAEDEAALPDHKAEAERMRLRLAILAA
ncbi:S49 family peptidase [Bradyrhizobium sp. 174]|uniref:S49 family peptidase n=1 Tax=Bradyrhizobium sp. 174 TaxID=2782645 RepID=UPI001FF85BDA|nr:S49 family peptidase [Bradyrhizobium sp. 174]MCK1577810.1 S49 family peptidase [Bradyrhizobium sp. 174]